MNILEDFKLGNCAVHILRGLRKYKMNNEIIIDILGYGGGGLFIIKVIIHVYIKRVTNKKYSFGTFGRFTDPVFFLPIFEVVKPNLEIVKKIENVLYIISVILLVSYLIMAIYRQSALKSSYRHISENQ